jgi:hypothetical protein
MCESNIDYFKIKSLQDIISSRVLVRLKEHLVWLEIAGETEKALSVKYIIASWEDDKDRMEQVRMAPREGIFTWNYVTSFWIYGTDLVAKLLEEEWKRYLDEESQQAQ